MSNALDGRDGPPTSDRGTREGAGYEPTFERGSGLATSATFEDGLFGTGSIDRAEAAVDPWLVRMAGAAGTVVAAGVGVGAWSSLGTPTGPAGSAVLVTGLLVAAAFARRTHRRLAALDPS